MQSQASLGFRLPSTGFLWKRMTNHRFLWIGLTNRSTHAQNRLTNLIPTQRIINRRSRLSIVTICLSAVLQERCFIGPEEVKRKLTKKREGRIVDGGIWGGGAGESLKGFILAYSKKQNTRAAPRLAS